MCYMYRGQPKETEEQHWSMLRSSSGEQAEPCSSFRKQLWRIEKGRTRTVRGAEWTRAWTRQELLQALWAVVEQRQLSNSTGEEDEVLGSEEKENLEMESIMLSVWFLENLKPKPHWLQKHCGQVDSTEDTCDDHLQCPCIWRTTAWFKGPNSTQKMTFRTRQIPLSQTAILPVHT